MLWLPAKQQVRGPQPSLVPVSCRYLLANFLVSLTGGANTGQIWRSGKICVLVTEWAWSVGVYVAFWFSLVRQPCWIVLE